MMILPLRPSQQTRRLSAWDDLGLDVVDFHDTMFLGLTAGIKKTLHTVEQINLCRPSTSREQSLYLLDAKLNLLNDALELLAFYCIAHGAIRTDWLQANPFGPDHRWTGYDLNTEGSK